MYSNFTTDTMSAIEGLFDRYLSAHPGIALAPRSAEALQRLKAPAREISSWKNYPAEPRAQTMRDLSTGLPPSIAARRNNLPASAVRKWAWDAGYRYTRGAHPVCIAQPLAQKIFV